MHLLHKTQRIEVKAGLVDFAARTFTGYAAVYNNRDDGGDIIVPGAFDKTLPRVAAGKVKLIDGHDYWDGTEKVVGKAIAAVSDDVGLLVTFVVAKGDEGDVLLNKIADGIIDALSIGYTVMDFEMVTDDEGKVTRFLKEVKLYEVSVVIWGMNALALIDPTSVKNLPATVAEFVKAGARNSASDAEVIQGCIDALQTLLDTPKSTTPPAPEGKSDEDTPGQDDDAAAPPEGDDDHAEEPKQSHVSEVIAGLIAHGL